VEEDAAPKSTDRRILWRLLTYLAPYRGAVLASLACLLVHSLLQAAGPLLTKFAIDTYFTKANTKNLLGLPADPAAGLALITALYLAALITAMLAEYGQTWLTQFTGQRAMFDLRRHLMQRLQQLDIPYFDRNPVGRLVTRVTSDVDTLNELFTSGLVTIIGDLTMLVFVSAAMFQLSPGLTLILWLVLPFVVLTAAIFRRHVAQSYRRIRTAVAKINSYLQEHINGIQVLQLMNREALARQHFTGINREHMLAFKDSILAYGWFYPVVEFLSMLALAALLVYGGYRVQEGALSLGILVAFLQYGMRFFRPIGDLSEKFNILQSAVAAAERVFALLDTQPTVTSPAQPQPFPSAPAALEFDEVWFAYKKLDTGEPDWILRGVSFRIDPGETIAVVGHTGAGKTTLINLLLRFYDPQRGAIRLGGIDLRQLPLADLRRHFGVVLQDPFLFTGAIADNIRLGDHRVGETAMRQAAARVNLLPFIESLPAGFAHELRERGQGLSSGQKQLVGFARALARNPRFLILDEATSSVDTETELQVRAALHELVTGRTSIVIAHRLSTIQQADRIFVMHKGQLRESGPHQQLLAQRGIYYRLYQLQYKDQDATASTPATT
jgi:ATP-binding cassette, subfamily B, multidrug efflux pump